MLLLTGKINGSSEIEFILDTGCSSMLLSKEMGDILFLSGKLVESDIKGTSTSSYGGVFSAEHQEINIRHLSLGKVKLKNLSASISDRYGGPSLLGMSALDKMKGFSIKKDMLIVGDSNTNTVITTGKTKDKKINKTQIKDCFQQIHKSFVESDLDNYKFDYTKHATLLYYLIQSCFPLLEDKKYDLACMILEELQILLKENLKDDEEHLYQKGSFITAYFYYYLALAYNGLERYEEALVYFEKARRFFLTGCPILNDIEGMLRMIREKLQKSEKDKAFAPAKTTTFEEDVQSNHLQLVKFEDHYYGNGDIKYAYVGFQDFGAAYNFCRMNHKRLEMLKIIDGKWQRTGIIPSENLNSWNLEIEEGYKSFHFESDIDFYLEKITKQLGDNKKEIEHVTKNAEKAKEIFKTEKNEKRYYSAVILRDNDLAFDALIKEGASLSWHGQELIMAALDVEEFITIRLSDDVLSGRIIPCAIGQMPEDYIYLADKTHELKAFCEDDYCANNDPARSRCMGPFILYDGENCVGYGFRATYDDKIWRWENVKHFNIGGFPESGDDISIEIDHRICYWQLVIQRKEDCNGLIHPEAI